MNNQDKNQTISKYNQLCNDKFSIVKILFSIKSKRSNAKIYDNNNLIRMEGRKDVEWQLSNRTSRATYINKCSNSLEERVFLTLPAKVNSMTTATHPKTIRSNEKKKTKRGKERRIKNSFSSTLLSGWISRRQP